MQESYADDEWFIRREAKRTLTPEEYVRWETSMRHKKSDGGRSKYFQHSFPGDCIVRAISLATETDYKIVFSELTDLAYASGMSLCTEKVWTEYLKGRGWRERRFPPRERVTIRQRCRGEEWYKRPEIWRIVIWNHYLIAVKGRWLHDLDDYDHLKCWRVWEPPTIKNN